MSSCTDQRTSAIPRRARAGDPGWGKPGKPAIAVVAVAKVLRTLHASERPLHASEVARAAGLHHGTAYNILRTLHAEGLVGYDEATRSYSVSLHTLELAHGVLRRSGRMGLARVREARQCGFAVNRGTMFQGITPVSVPVLSPSWELLLDLTAVGPLSRAMRSAAARLSKRVISSITPLRGRQHGWMGSGSRQNFH
jgi:DNA-binding IclR family transcriptional regulator